jgi:hypothetical protein
VSESAPAPAPGCMVHYVMPDGPRAGEVRPAMVIRGLPNAAANLQIFLDGPNDAPGSHVMPTSVWMGTVAYDPLGAPGTWHWPARL